LEQSPGFFRKEIAMNKRFETAGRNLFAALVFAALLQSPVAAADVLAVYGPGGPLPAMKEAGEIFGKQNNIKVEVTAGPTRTWIEKAKADADLIYSGSEHMMTDLIEDMEGGIDESTVTPLYMRPAAILVRPGNPKMIKDFPDLLRPGMKVIVVQGAGQTGLWEDIAGRRGDIKTVKAFRKNIAAFAGNSAEAKKMWTERTDIDAWLIYTIWQFANPTLADLVPLSEDWVLYRDCGIALTRKGGQEALARKFFEFLQSAEGAKIFVKWGWITEK
jgi:accessory colonization factor AcfC